MGRWRMVRIIARDRGIRHAIRDTKSNVRINTNHQDPKTSKNPARRKSEPKNGCASRYDATRWGLLGICGRSEPTAAPAASRISNTRAVRIDRRVRHTSANDCRRVKRGGAEGLMGPTGCYCDPDRSEAGREALERSDQVSREGGRDEHDPHPDEQRPGGHRDHPVVPPEPPERAGEPLDPKSDQEERNTEPERVHDEQDDPARGALGARDEEDP